MASNAPFLRPLAIAAGALGTVQAIIWGILSLLGILLYNGDIEWQPSFNVTDRFQTALVHMYFVPIPMSLGHMTPGTVVAWTATYFATSVTWLVISGFLLHESHKSKFTSKVIIGWVTVSGVIAAIDFAGTVAFGVDHYRVQRELDIVFHSTNFGVEYLLAPVFMMVMCARGFILWIINVGLVIYLGVAERKLYKEDSPNLSQDPEYLSHHQGRKNTAFQPNSIYGCDTHSPTVGNQQPSQRNFLQKNSSRTHNLVNPTPPITRAGKPLPPTVVPLPIPQPDYPRQMQRQKHEPNMNEARTRPVQMRANLQRQSYF